jgi:tRNA(Ile)-lysidine synthase
MMKLIAKVRMTIERYQMLRGGEKVIIGVSGGPDSICLLHVLLDLKSEYRIELVIAHINHSLRGGESLRDEAFIKNIAQEVNLPCLITRLDPDEYQKIRGISLQEKARQLRYSFLNEVLEKEHGDKIALGHNADDQAETLLLWLIRGTGTRGLSGIPPVRGNIFIRPLIEVERTEIEEFLAQRRLEYIRDSSNYENKYLRNRIRYELIPYLKSNYNPQLVSTLKQTSNILRAEEEFLEDICEKYGEECLIRKENKSIIFNVEKLKYFPLAIQLRMLRKGILSIKGNLRQITYKHILSIIQLISKSGSSKILCLPGGVKVAKEYNHLVIDKGEKKKPSFSYIFSSIPDNVKIREITKEMNFSLMKKVKNLLYADERNTAYLDNSKICFPMVIRSCKREDWFYPSGMKGRKKIKDFFSDEKIPISERIKVPLLLFRDRIAWVGGFRVDQKIAATRKTKYILRVELKDYL